MSESDKLIHMWAAVPPWNNKVVLGRSQRPPRVSSSVWFCRGKGLGCWSALTCPVFCGMSAAGVMTVSLIYHDNCKHVKSQARSILRHEVVLISVGSTFSRTYIVGQQHVPCIKARHSPSDPVSAASPASLGQDAASINSLDKSYNASVDSFLQVLFK